MNQGGTIDAGRRVLRAAAAALTDVARRLGPEFDHAVALLHETPGRAVLTGMGKSGLVARKIAATLASTGTPALYLHPAEALHGDLGMIVAGDVVVALSYSGETAELIQLLGTIRRLGAKIVVLTGRIGSTLSREADVLLDTSVAEEGCPLNLAPMASTTAALALGDALAVALLDRRGFTEDEFALYHPGGMLGRRLLLRVDEIMVSGDAVPRVGPSVPLRDAIMEMTTKRLGCTCVVGEDGKLLGIITDGDLRRLLATTADVSSTTAAMVMTRRPKTIAAGTLAVVAIQEMESYNITQIIVADPAGRPVGVIHLHDLVKLGLGGDERS